jgi:DNA-binding NarL/FixJ family response regulator
VAPGRSKPPGRSDRRGVSRSVGVVDGPIRVVVGEDQPLLREGIVRVLQDSGFQVVASAADAAEMVGKVHAYQPDIVVTDIQMPPDRTDDGLRAALEIRASQPAVGVLVLSQFLEDRYAFELVSAGAQGVGYLLKEKVGDLDTFTDAVRRVAGGGSALDPDVVARLIGRPRRNSPLDQLSKREREVLALIAEGRSNAGVAQALVISVAAVERHVTSIFDKLGLHQSSEQHRRVLAVLTYLRA